MPANYKEIKDNIRRIIGNTNAKLLLNWTITRFLHMMWDSVFYSSPVNVERSVKISLKMEPARNLTEEEKEVYSQSSRKFGYMFFIDIEGAGFTDEWRFIPAPEIKKRLEQMLETDKIYELTRS